MKRAILILLLLSLLLAMTACCPIKAADKRVKAEVSDKGMDVATQARVSELSKQVSERKGEIEKAYQQANIKQQMVMDITLYIGDNGKVEVVEIVPRESYPTSFLNEVKHICENWEFKWNEKTVYPFTVSLKP